MCALVVIWTVWELELHSERLRGVGTLLLEGYCMCLSYGNSLACLLISVNSKDKCVQGMLQLFPVPFIGLKSLDHNAMATNDIIL